MKNSSFISDKDDLFSDESKIIFKLFSEDINNFITKRRRKIIGASLSAVVGVIGLIMAIYILAVLGAVCVIVFSVLLENKISKRINKIGLVGLPVTQFPFEGDSIFIDRSGLLPEKDFCYPRLSPELIHDIYNDYNALKSLVNRIPVIYINQNVTDLKRTDNIYEKENLHIYAEESELINTIKSLKIKYKERNDFSIKLSALNKHSPLIHLFVNDPRYNSAKIPIIEKDSVEQTQSRINDIAGVVELHNTDKTVGSVDIDDITLNLLKLLKDLLPRFKYTLNNTFTKYAFDVEDFSFSLTNLAFNNYCPYCNSASQQKLLEGKYPHQDGVDNRVNFDINSKVSVNNYTDRSWHCPLCKKQTNDPLRTHRMFDELFKIVYDKLYEENYIERLKIYNHINDEKRKYLEKAETQFHEVIRDNRNKIDNIKSKVRTIRAEVSADEMAIRKLMETLSKFEQMAETRSAQIQSEINQIKHEIKLETERNFQEIENIVNVAKSTINQKCQQYAFMAREDQAKRDQVHQQMANDIAKQTDINQAFAEKAGLTDKSFLRDPFKGIRQIGYNLGGLSAVEKGNKERSR